jgi:hypothetical protein
MATNIEDSNGWLRLHTSKLDFSPHCLGCGESTEDSREFRVTFRRNFIEVLGNFKSFVIVQVPMCPACSKSLENRDVYVGLAGALVGIIVGVPMGLLIGDWLMIMPEATHVLAGLCALVLGVVFYLHVPRLIGFRAPVRFRAGTPRGVFELWIENRKVRARQLSYQATLHLEPFDGQPKRGSTVLALREDGYFYIGTLQNFFELNSRITFADGSEAWVQTTNLMTDTLQQNAPIEVSPDVWGTEDWQSATVEERFFDGVVVRGDEGDIRVSLDKVRMSWNAPSA